MSAPLSLSNSGDGPLDLSSTRWRSNSAKFRWEKHYSRFQLARKMSGMDKLIRDTFRHFGNGWKKDTLEYFFKSSLLGLYLFCKEFTFFIAEEPTFNKIELIRKMWTLINWWGNIVCESFCPSEPIKYKEIIFPFTSDLFPKFHIYSKVPDRTARIISTVFFQLLTE